ncbi:MAG TPA: hypothetical protein PKC21_02860 [Oligoflexia bacterium]|nr:hypothetical protein [Oligoflexia bacterium]HMR24273.1 hypothetical protein [Oligoflexia bacterium]
MSYIKHVLLVSLLGLSSAFAFNINYLATYVCDEAHLKDAQPSNFNQDACEQGFLMGYQDYYQSNSGQKSNIDQLVLEYALGSSDTSLKQWFIKGYALAEQLEEYNPCLAYGYCSTQTVNDQLEQRFISTDQIDGCNAGFKALNNGHKDAQDYRSLIDTINSIIAGLNNNADYKEGFYFGAIQGFRCH